MGWDTEDLVAALQHAASSALHDGRAQLEVIPRTAPEPGLVRLSPRNDAAASVLVQIDDDDQVTVQLGAHQLPIEIRRTDAERLLSEVSELVATVVNDGYVELSRRKRGKMQILAEIGRGPRKRTATYNLFRGTIDALRNREGWTETRYTGYCDEGS